MRVDEHHYYGGEGQRNLRDAEGGTVAKVEMG